MAGEMQKFVTHLPLKAGDFDDVTVFWKHCKAEYGFPATIDLYAVDAANGTDLLDVMTDFELAELEDDVARNGDSYAEDYRY